MAYQKGHHVIYFPEKGSFIIAKITKVDINDYTLKCVTCDDESMIGEKQVMNIFSLFKFWRYIPEKQLDSYLKLYS